MPVLYDIHHNTASLRVEGLHAEVVEDEQVGTLDAFKFVKDRTFHFWGLKLADQLSRTRIKYTEAVSAGFIAQRGGQVTLACSSGAGNEQVPAVPDELHGGQAFDLIAVQPPLVGAIYLFERGIITEGRFGDTGLLAQ